MSLGTSKVPACFHISDSARVALLSNAGKISVTRLVPVWQEVAAVEAKCGAGQKELRRTQQLLRQLERQLAKSHMTRKESANTSQQLQVAFKLTNV